MDQHDSLNHDSRRMKRVTSLSNLKHSVQHLEYSQLVNAQIIILLNSQTEEKRNNSIQERKEVERNERRKE